MAKTRRDCGCGCKDNGGSSRMMDPGNTVSPSMDLADINIRTSSRNFGRCFFPTNIKKLLALIAEDEGDNRIDIVLDACANHCFIEDAKPIAVVDNTLILRDCDKFKFVCIDCICEVIVDCDTILEELFEQHSLGRE